MAVAYTLQPLTVKMAIYAMFNPTRQGSSITRRIRTWRRYDNKLWADMKVFRTSFHVPASKERNSYAPLGRDFRATSFLRFISTITNVRKKTKGTTEGRSLDVRGRLAEWELIFDPHF